MRAILTEKGGGKTDRLIALCAKSNAEASSYIVAADITRVRAIFKRSQWLGHDIPFPITFDEFLGGRFHSTNIKRFFIDDADDLLRRWARGVDIAAVSITGDIDP